MSGLLNRAGPSGRIIEHDSGLCRYTMDVDPPKEVHRVVPYDIAALRSCSP